MPRSFIDKIYSSETPLVGPEGLDLENLPAPVALTGATGFVGSHLLQTLQAAELPTRVLLRNTSSARWIDTEPSACIEGSLEDISSLEKLVDGARTVIHLAGALRAPSAAAFMKGNAGGTRRLVEAIRKNAPNTRLLYCSSQAAAGPSQESEGLSVDAELHPISAYGRSKAAAEELVHDSGLDWRILRPPAIYGPRDGDVFEFFRMASRGWMPYPAGERRLTVAFIGDVVRALLRAAVVGGHASIYHAGPVESIRMHEMLRSIADGGDTKARLLPIPPLLLTAAGWGASLLRSMGMRNIPLSRDKAREILARHWLLDCGPSLRELGIRKTIPMEEGIRLSWEWYRRIGWLE